MWGVCVCVYFIEGQLDSTGLLGAGGPGFPSQAASVTDTNSPVASYTTEIMYLQGRVAVTGISASPLPSMPSDTTQDSTATPSRDVLPQLWSRRH